jgi:hypothetical protein
MSAVLSALLVLNKVESEPYHVPLSKIKPDPDFDMAGWDGKPAPFKPHHDPERMQAIRDKNAASVSRIRASIRAGHPMSSAFKTYLTKLWTNQQLSKFSKETLLLGGRLACHSMLISLVVDVLT